MIVFWISFAVFILVVICAYPITKSIQDTGFVALMFGLFAFGLICVIIPERSESIKVDIEIVERPDAVYVFAGKYQFIYKDYEDIRYLQTYPDSAILVKTYNTYGINRYNTLKFYK